MPSETGRTPEEAVLAWTEAWNAKDWEALEAVFDPDAEVVAPPGWPEAGQFRGWPAVRDQFKRLMDAWTEERTEVVSMQAIGEVVLYHGRWLGRGGASGLPLDLDFWTVCDVRNGRLTRVRYFFDGEHARAVAEGGRRVRFEKWQALGNDYVIVEREGLPWELTPTRIRRICEPHFGAGSDGILLLGPASDSAHVAELRIFNPDGSEAELSGNGAREAVLYLRSHGWTDDDTFTIITKAGEVTPTIAGPETVAMAIGRASVTSADYPNGPADGTGTVSSAGREWAFQHVNVGNPQCAIEVAEGLEELDLGEIGPAIEGNTELFPNRTNVSFWNADGSTVRARIFERGVGETLSSGTGASGAAVAAHLGGAKSPITVKLDGGELTVEVRDDLEVTLTGSASPVYAGELSAEFVRALEDA